MFMQKTWRSTGRSARAAAFSVAPSHRRRFSTAAGGARAPGWGEVDWPKFISAVILFGYKGNLDIEHEDDIFASMRTIHSIKSEADVVSNYSQERAGLRLGYNTLSKLIVT